MATSQDFVNWVCGPDLDSHFLMYLFQASRDYIRELASGAIHKTVYMPTAQAFHVCLPPLDAQRRIALDLQEKLCVATSLCAALEVQLTQIEALSGTLLSRALSGGLSESKWPAVREPSRKGIVFKRGAIAAYAINRLHQRREFGRVQFQKILYLTEAYVGIDLGGEYDRAAAGPLDNTYLIGLESLAKKQGWFTKHRRGAEGYFYRPGPQIGNRLLVAEKILADSRGKMDRLLSAFARMDTEQAEVFATVFSAWNDFLIDGRSPSDEEIVDEVRSNWHDAKQRFDPDRLRRALNWMRANDFVPQGTGPRTRTTRG